MSEGRKSKIIARAEERVRAREKREKMTRFESCDWGKEFDCDKKGKKIKRQNSENYKNCEDYETCKNCNSGKILARELPQELPRGEKTESEITLADIMKRKQMEKREGIVY